MNQILTLNNPCKVDIPFKHRNQINLTVGYSFIAHDISVFFFNIISLTMKLRKEYINSCNHTKVKLKNLNHQW